MPAAEPAHPPGPIALIVGSFPAITQSFILRELVELERQGVEVLLMPLLHGSEATLHPDAARWDRRALHSPLVSAEILRSNLAVARSAPARYLGTLARLLWDARSSGSALRGVAATFLKSVYNGQRLRERAGVHIHAQFATHPAAAAFVMSRVHRRDQDDIPYSVTVHAYDIFGTRAGLKRKLGQAAFVRSISEFNVDYLCEHLGPGGPPRDRFRVIHCGVDPGWYGHRPAAGIPGRDRVADVLCIASLYPYKGVRYLVEAFRLLRADGARVRCEVIGEGVLRPKLEAQIREAGLESHLVLAGTRPQEGVAEALARCDLFVLPSIVADDGLMEGIPVALMEALASTVPVISTRVSGIPELVIPGETGMLVEPKDPRALANAIRAVLDDYPAAKALAAKGRLRVERHFEIRKNVTRLIGEITACSNARHTRHRDPGTPGPSSR